MFFSIFFLFFLVAFSHELHHSESGKVHQHDHEHHHQHHRHHLHHHDHVHQHGHGHEHELRYHEHNNQTRKIHHKCIHTVQQKKQKVLKLPFYKENPFKKVARDGRRLVPNYAPIRIRPYYDSTVSRSGMQAFVKQTVSSSILFFESFMKVIPIEGNFAIPRKCSSYYTNDVGGQSCARVNNFKCGQVTVPNNHLEDGYVFDNRRNPQSLRGGNGLRNADYVVYVSVTDSGCKQNTLAWATYCMQDSFTGRPTVGTINFCKNKLKNPTTMTSYKKEVAVAFHEITHAVIMSPNLWSDFIDANGNKISRNAVMTKSGKYNWIKSPKLRQVAQAHYSCNNDRYCPGLPLEDSGGKGSVGAHWDELYVNSEYMGSTITSSLIYVSSLTFALMEDSGWYQIDYNMAEPYFWGKGNGCSFLRDQCVTQSRTNFPQYFCTSASDNGCTYDYMQSAGCQFYKYVKNVAPYFTDNSYGGSQTSDFCPWRNGYGNTFPCHSPDQRNKRPYETYGAGSRCLATTDPRYGSQVSGMCYSMTCNVQQGTVTVSANINGRREQVTCSQRDEFQKRRLGSLTVECPKISTICYNANAIGRCVYGYYNENLRRCVCQVGFSGATCANKETRLAQEAQVSPQAAQIPYQINLQVGNSRGVYTKYSSTSAGFPIYRGNNGDFISFDLWNRAIFVGRNANSFSKTGYYCLPGSYNKDYRGCRNWQQNGRRVAGTIQ